MQGIKLIDWTLYGLVVIPMREYNDKTEESCFNQFASLHFRDRIKEDWTQASFQLLFAQFKISFCRLNTFLDAL